MSIATEVEWQEAEPCQQPDAQQEAEVDPLSIPENVFPVPQGQHSYTLSAEHIFPSIAQANLWFIRGGIVHEVEHDIKGARLLPLVKERAVSGLEEFARSCGRRIARFETVTKGDKTYPVWRTATMPTQSMDILMQSNAARQLLPRIRQLVACPVIVERPDNRTETLAAGYHSHGGGTYITAGQMPPEVPLNAALDALLNLHADFLFSSPSDKSRTIAAALSPALKMGGFIPDDFPMHVAEAVESQSGKDYLQKLHSRIYNERPAGIAPSKGGVGSLDETLSKALISGRPFICFSNFRGKLESAILESAIRGQGSIECRALRTSATVDCTPFIWQLSTNGAEFTRDLANRAIVTRIRKQPASYVFTEYPEGDLMSHVQSNQPFYLGCVFSILREWVACGKPKTADTRHDFRGWTQTLDWIVQKIFQLPPLLDGHQEQQSRTANPALQWLRDVANVIIGKPHAGRAFSAVEFADLCEEEDIPLPGRPGSTEEPKFRIGKTLGKLFKEGQVVDENTSRLTADGIAITREVFEEYNPKRQETITRQRYFFAKGEA